VNVPLLNDHGAFDAMVNVWTGWLIPVADLYHIPLLVLGLLVTTIGFALFWKLWSV